MRITRDEFQHKPLRGRALLTDVPLHDVWTMDLRGGGEGRTLEDFGALLWYERAETIGSVVGWLFRVRLTLGRWLGWDDERHRAPSSSYVHRLTAEDRATSLDEPGGISGVMGVPTKVVYAFENEELHEITNFTGHHLLLMSMERASQGYTVYLAVYTKKTSWFTPLYMALIDPFRRILVYPALIRKLERAWGEAYKDQPKSHLSAEL